MIKFDYLGSKETFIVIQRDNEIERKARKLVNHGCYFKVEFIGNESDNLVEMEFICFNDKTPKNSVGKIYPKKKLLFTDVIDSLIRESFTFHFKGEELGEDD